MAKHRAPDMPRLVLNVNVNEIAAAAAFGANAIMRLADQKPGRGSILTTTGADGGRFCAYRTKTSVVIWSQQETLPNPLAASRRGA